MYHFRMRRGLGMLAAGALSLVLLLASAGSAGADGGLPTIEVQVQVQSQADGSMKIHYERTYENTTDQPLSVHEMVKSPARDAKGGNSGVPQVTASGGVKTRTLPSGIQANVDLAARGKADLTIDYTLAPQTALEQQGLVWLLEAPGNLAVDALHVKVIPPTGAKLAPGVGQVSGKVVDVDALPQANGLVVQNADGPSTLNPSVAADGSWEVKAFKPGLNAQISLVYALERPAPMSWSQIVVWAAVALILGGAAVGIVFSLRRERAEKAAEAAQRQKQRTESKKR